MAEIATVCPYCGCGCGLYLHVSEGRVVGTAPSRVHPVSQGGLCVKGWHAHELVDNPGRLRRPLIRRGDDLAEAPWDKAVKTAAQGLRKVLKARGPQAVGVLGSARCTNEDNYVLVRFARATLGTANIDCSLRARCFPEISRNGAGPGPWASTGQIGDLGESDLIILVGSDPTEEHPAAATQVYRARQRGARLVTISTRRHPLARLADVHLPVSPGAEARLIGSILHVLLKEWEVEGGQHEELTALRSSVADLRPEALAGESGVTAEDIRQAAQLYRTGGRATIAYAAGLALSPEGASALRALGSLAALAAASDGPRVTLLSLLARNNLQGCQDMGVAPDILPGYAQLADDAAAGKLEATWGCSLNREAGISAWDMPGKVQAMYVMGDDPIANSPNPEAVREALSRLEFLVVQDLFMTPVAALADVVLPGAAFAERGGSWTNLERRVQRVTPAGGPPDEAREDWRIVAELSGAMGMPMPYEDEQQLFDEIADLLPIYAGISPATLSAVGGVQWPASEGGAKAGSGAGDGPADVAPASLQPVAGDDPPPKTDEQHPLLLVPDPTLRPWDGEVTVCTTLSAAVEFDVVGRDYPEGMLLLSREDADRSGLRSGQTAQVTSARGERRMRVRVTEEAPGGVALMPYGQASRSGLFEVAAAPGTGRPLLTPTSVSVAPAE